MMGGMKTARIITLGCKTNQYEGEELARALAALGVCVDDSAAPDIAIVNTCTVTERADRKCRQAVTHLAREFPRAAIYVTGCYAARQPRELSTLPNVVAVCADKRELAEFIARNQHLPLRSTLPTDSSSDVAHPPPGEAASSPSSQPGAAAPHKQSHPGAGVPHQKTAETHPGAGVPHQQKRQGRAYLKIQDGCDAFCAYCIVPYVRPTLRSEPLEAILREARAIVDAGFLEIVLTGIHLGRYASSSSPVGGHPCVAPPGFSASGEKNGKPGGHTGPPLQKKDLVDVIREVAARPGLARLRLSSLEMPEVSNELLDLMATSPARQGEAQRSPVICPHLHLPLQSGDDGVLAAMNRRYTAADFLATVARVRSRIPEVAITTDVIAGFPGESDAAFENTLRVCREARFSRVHVFPFSARPGTKAATLPRRLPARVVTRRKHELLALADALALDYKRRFLGRTVEVLVETIESDESGRAFAWGLTPHYLRVRLPAEDGLVGRIVPVAVENATAERLEGRRVTGKDK